MMKYDDICIPTDEIYMRVSVHEKWDDYETLRKVSGFKFMFCGREIGVHKYAFNMMWRATDMKTGLKINFHDYGTRGHLIRGLLNHIDVYQKAFSEFEKLADREVEFQLLMRDMEKKHGCEKSMESI